MRGTLSPPIRPSTCLSHPPGSPSTDQLPSAYGKGPFCHSCQTNQMLLVNLLSSYLPSPDVRLQPIFHVSSNPLLQSPDYRRRLEKLPEYKESLHARYPPVCDACLPAVQEEIRNRDHMARTKALGGWLKESKGKDHRRRISGFIRDRDHLTFEILAWRIRGVLWVSSLIIAVLVYSAGMQRRLIVPYGGLTMTAGYLQYSIPWTAKLLPFLPVLVIVSLLWTAWDPTYSAFRKAQIQGRDVRVKGKREYIVSRASLTNCVES